MSEKPQKSSEFPDSFHRVSVKGLFVKDGKVMLVKEPLSLGGTGGWELPGGGLDFGEKIQDALSREILEETGLVVTSVSKNPTYVWTSRIENRRGLQWFYSLVLAYRIEIANLDFKPSAEGEAIGFFSKDELEEINISWQTKNLKDVFNASDFS